MDQWVQKIAALIVLLTSAVTLYSSRQGAACWCPSTVTSSQVDYIQQWCSSNASTHHPLPPDGVVLPPGPASSGDPVRRAGTLLGENTILLKYLAGEIILVCTLYSLIKSLTCCSKFDVLFAYDLHQSYSKAPAYILVQLFGCAIWVLFAILTYTAYPPELFTVTDEPFICDFDIHRLGSIYRYSVQCVDASESGMKMAIMTNMGLCVVVAFSKLVHIVAVFGIQPLLTAEKMATRMVERKVIGESGEMSLGFGLSDLYFAILVSGRDVMPLLTMKGQQVEQQFQQKLPYSSRPPSMIC